MPLAGIVERTLLGSSDLFVSRVGFGGWAVGGHGWGKVDDRTSVQSIRRAYELGITLFDTADVYGFGHSEEILREALAEDRKRVTIATKVGVRWTETGQTFRDASPAWVVQAVEGSLRRLKLDCLPLLQIHWPDPKTPLEATMETLKKCQQSGKVRYIGCSNFPAQMVRQGHQLCCLVSCQAPYNLVDQGVEADVLPCCGELGIGFIGYNPLAQGLLSGKYGAASRFEADDVRSRSPYFRAQEIKRNLGVVAKLREIGARYGKTPAQVAMRWILDQPHVTCIIPGIKTPEQAEQNAGAMGWDLDTEDQNRLARLAEIGGEE